MPERNPFHFGDAVTGEYFADRENELKELMSDVVSGQNVIVYSPRRYGKTSLIKTLIDQAEQQGIICIYFDCNKISSRARFVELYAKAITQGLATKVDEVKRVVREFLPGFLPKIVIKGESEVPDIEFEFSTKTKSIQNTLDYFYDLPQKVAQKRKRRVLVVFDEFQEVLNLNGLQIEKEMRSYIQHHLDVCYIFMGSKKHLMFDVFLDSKRPFYNFGKLFRLRKIPQKIIAQFIQAKFESTGFAISKNAIEKIVQLADNHPYSIQMLSHMVWFQNWQMKKVETRDVELALTSVIANRSELYFNIWDSLSLHQKNLVVAIARSGGENIFSKDYILEHDLGAQSTIQKSLRGLLNRDVLEKENDFYKIADIFFEEWLKRYVL